MESEVKTLIREKIRQYVPKARDRAEILSTDRWDDLGAKALCVLEVIMGCEDAYSGVVYVTDEEAEALRTVGDLEQLVIRKIRNPQEQPA